jgi:transposase
MRVPRKFLGAGMKAREKARLRERFVKKAYAFTRATDEKIAGKLGVTSKTIQRIKKRSGLSRPVPLATGLKKGSTYGQLTPAQRKTAVDLYFDGMSQREIAEIFRVSQPAIQKLIKNRKSE